MRFTGASLLFSLSATMVIACGGGGGGGTPDYVSDNPGAASGPSDGDAGETGAAGEDGGDGEDRELQEADIVALEGDRLYALSPYGGLSVVDAADPDDMQVLGRWRAHAQPFEMYVDAGQVFAMFSDFGSYLWEDDIAGWQWRTSSRLVALDASDPDDIVVRGDLELPGWIQDSRRVGDVLYVVTNEDGACWGCATQANTTVTSFDISDPAAPVMRDQLVFEDVVAAWEAGGPRPVASTTERMYIASMDAASWEDGRSAIDVVDISDPSGILVAGANLRVAGIVANRWQMDEHEGVLRVVSQPWQWGGESPPVVETFGVMSASEVVPLGSTTMTLPRPEALRSVRFDGPRGYAITFEQIDPLFTLDLSDPAAPRQIGELEIPGWVEYIEPRGDRLLGLGFDPNNPEGSLNVSLFDVADFAAPALLSRVHFGGDWGELGDDPDRIHKAFTVLDEEGLLLVPFSGFSEVGFEGPCYGAWTSGVQLVDWSGDALVRRGLAQAHGRARRALLHRERLIGMSDKALESFDITDRDQPAKTDEIALAVSATNIGVGAGIAVRLAQDWWTNEAALEVVAMLDAENPEPLGRLDLGSLLASDDPDGACGWASLYGAETFVKDGYAYLVYEAFARDASMETTRIAAIDLRDPTTPTLVATLELPFSRGWGSYSSYEELGSAAERAVLVGDALVLPRHEIDWEPAPVVSRARFEVVDLSQPGTPVYAAGVERPDALAHGELAVFGRTVVSWHMQAALPDASHVRFFFDRLDVSDPNDPIAATPVNVPGVIAAWDEATGHAATVDFERENIARSSDECWSHPRAIDYDSTSGTCVLLGRSLRLVRIDDGAATVLDALDVEGELGRLAAVRAADDRLFAVVSHSPWSWGWAEDAGIGAQSWPADQVAVVTGLPADRLVERARLEVPGGGWSAVLATVGTELLLTAQTGLAEVDASDADAPTLEVHALYGWGCWDIAVTPSTAYCALGEQGVQAIPLGSSPQ